MKLNADSYVTSGKDYQRRLRREGAIVQFLSHPVLILKFLSYPMTISATIFDTRFRSRHTRGPVARSSMLFQVLSVAFRQLAGQLRTLVLVHSFGFLRKGLVNLALYA